MKAAMLTQESAAPARPRDAETIWRDQHSRLVPFDRWEPTYAERQEYMRAARGEKR